MDQNIPVNLGKNVEVPGGFNYPKMNLLQRIIGVIFSPGKVMQSLEQKPRILFALLLTIITPVVMIFSVLPMYMEYSRTVMEATYEKMNMTVTPQQIDQALNLSRYTSPAGIAIKAAAMWFLGALILWAIIKIFKGSGKYMQILSITGYATVIIALGTIVKIVITLVTGTYIEQSATNINLAILLPNLKGSFIFGAAKAIDVFSIWQYVVIAIGTATVSKLDKKKVYIIIACIFAVLVIYSGVMEVSMAGII